MASEEKIGDVTWKAQEYGPKERCPQTGNFKAVKRWVDERELRQKYRDNYDRIFGKKDGNP